MQLSLDVDYTFIDVRNNLQFKSVSLPRKKVSL